LALLNNNYQHSQQRLAEVIATNCVTKERAQSILLAVVIYVIEQISHCDQFAFWFLVKGGHVFVAVVVVVIDSVVVAVVCCCCDCCCCN